MVDTDEFGRAKALKILSFQRPFSRSFHFAWFGFFTGFLGWFAFAPLMNFVKDDLNLTKSDIDNSNIAAVTITILMRFMLGPLCDRFGPRRLMACVLLVGSIPVMLSSQVQGPTSLIVLRSFTGILGGAFVPCQFWTTMMYSSAVVGTANAFAGGWGNLGGGVTMLFMVGCVALLEGAGLGPTDAWRYSFFFPAAILISVAVPMLFFSDDCPQGGWLNRRYNKGGPSEADENGEKPPSIKQVVTDPRVWVLGAQYAACFGVELAVNNIAAIYFYEGFFKEDCDSELDASSCFYLDKKTASLVAALFGLMNLFARAFGGIISDKLNRRTETKPASPRSGAAW